MGRDIRPIFMPKTKLQNIIYTIIMAFVMVYAMICYNISLSTGGMKNETFLMAFGEMKIMWPVAIILEYFVVEKLAAMLAFRFVKPTDRPIVITIGISSMIVCLMCPAMSMIATILFKNPGREFIAVWLQTAALNFPMAMGWQIFFAGPFVRLVYRKIIEPATEKKSNDDDVEEVEEAV